MELYSSYKREGQLEEGTTTTTKTILTKRFGRNIAKQVYLGYLTEIDEKDIHLKRKTDPYI